MAAPTLLSTLAPPNSTSLPGTVLAAPGDTNQFWGGAPGWSFIPLATKTSASFTIPASGGTVAIAIVASGWPSLGQTLFIYDGTSRLFAEVTTVTSTTALTVTNRGYLGSAVSGTMGSGASVVLKTTGLMTASNPGLSPAVDNTTIQVVAGKLAAVALAYSALTGTPPALDALSVPTDITTLNASTSAHGLQAKGTGSTTTYYRSDLTQATPATFTRTVPGYTPASGGTSGITAFLCEDQTFRIPAGGGTAQKTIRQFSALDNHPPSTLYAQFNTRNGLAVLDFDPATLWNSVFIGIVPNDAVLTSGLSIILTWLPLSGTTGAAGWGAAIDNANTGLNADSYDTASTSVFTTVSGTLGTLVTTTLTLTTIDSLAVGNAYKLKIFRDAANASDTCTVNAQLFAVEVRTAN